MASLTMIAEIEEHDDVATSSGKDEHELEAFLPPEPRPELVPGLSKSRAPPTTKTCLVIAVNIGSATGLVFVNKLIFSDPQLRHAQVTFAALHFAITALTLYSVSLPPLHLFERRSSKTLTPLQILLAVAMIAAVVLTNASLAYSSIHFYQVARVLVTPLVAGMEVLILGKRLPGLAAVTLVPVCVGVGMVSYFDTADVDGVATGESRTWLLGVFFALISLVASATYTVMIKRYHESTGCGSAQLLLMQSPVSVLVMLYIIPFSDDITVWWGVGGSV